MSEFELRLFTEADFTQAKTVIAEAFREDPLFYYWCGNQGLAYERRLQFYAGVLNDLQVKGSGHSLGVFKGDRLAGLAYVKDSEALKSTDGMLPLLFRILFRAGPASLMRFIKVGTALPNHWPKNEHLYLSTLAVLPEHQGKGLGRQLLNAVSDYAQSEGVDQLCLDTQNPNNVGYYQSFGYAVVGEPKIDMLQSWCLVKNGAA